MLGVPTAFEVNGAFCGTLLFFNECNMNVVIFVMGVLSFHPCWVSMLGCVL